MAHKTLSILKKKNTLHTKSYLRWLVFLYVSITSQSAQASFYAEPRMLQTILDSTSSGDIILHYILLFDQESKNTIINHSYCLSLNNS